MSTSLPTGNDRDAGEGSSASAPPASAPVEGASPPGVAPAAGANDTSSSGAASSPSSSYKGRLVAKHGNIHIWGTDTRDGLGLTSTQGSGHHGAIGYAVHDDHGGGSGSGGGNGGGSGGSKSFPLGHHSRSKSRSLGSSGWQRKALKKNFPNSNFVDAYASATNAPIETFELDGDTGEKIAGEHNASAASAASGKETDAFHSGKNGTFTSPTADGSGSTASSTATARGDTCALSTASAATLRVPSIGSSATLGADGARRLDEERAAAPQNKLVRKDLATISLHTAGRAGGAETQSGAPKKDKKKKKNMKMQSNKNVVPRHEVSFATESIAEKKDVYETNPTVANNGGSTRASAAPDRDSSSKRRSSPSWEKVLWRRQPYPDNFVHTTFCDSVRDTRGHNQPFDYWTMVRHTAVLMQQLCVVVIFSTVFRLALIEDVQSEPRPDTPSISLRTLLHIDAALIVVLYAIYAVLSKHVPSTPGARPHMLAEPQRLLLFLVVLMAVSPVLHTLTKTYASDTIYLLAVLLGTVHIFSYDFTYMLTMSREFKGTVSMNAALLCSILLASRLSSNMHCFGLMCFAVELFSLTPILWHMLRVYSANAHAAFTTVMVVSVSVLLALTHRRFFGFLFVFSAVVIPFVAPLVFIRVQRFKVRIAGPWDLGGVNPVEDF